MAGGVFQRNFGGLSRTTFLLALSSMFADISTEMLYPVLPIFLTQTLHATGSIVGSSLEASNVDIATQFSQLIVAQQAYSANARVMSTANQMIQSLLQVIQ